MKDESNRGELRRQFEQRERQWKIFHEWEARQPPEQRDAARILADLGTIYSWLPPEVRAEDPDPEKKGIQTMRATLAHLNSHYE